MQKDELRFVIHKHKATTLHYDFRLEIGGVMPSWSIPKGPTLDNTLKRLAILTTDHALEYQHFEGIIPEGSYGAGPVMIWDEGFYIPEIEVAKGLREEIKDGEEAEKVMEEGMVKGELKFTLHGKKLQGSFALVKTKGWGPKDSWLMIKHNDKYVQTGFDAKDFDFSAVSGKPMKEIES